MSFESFFKPPKLETISIDEALANIRAVLDASGKFRGWLWMDESAFFVSTSHLKHAFAEEFKGLAPMPIGHNVFGASITAIDDLELQVEQGYCHFMGKVLVPAGSFEDKLRAVEDSIRELRLSLPSLAPTALTAQQVLADAHAEAAAIIEAAKREASQIGSKNSPVSPWSS